MPRFHLVALALISFATSTREDSFDSYTNESLQKLIESKSVRKVQQVTEADLVEHARVLPGITSAFLVVKTNEGRLAKLLALPARQKIDREKSVSIILLERFVTYREAEERTIQAQGRDVRLFGTFRFNIDWGQVVPAAVPADLAIVTDKDGSRIEAVDKAEVYLITQPVSEVRAKSAAGPPPGAPFTPAFFNGAFKLHEDGRRSGTLHLKVNGEGEVLGHYYSDKDGQKYEVAGKVSNPNNSIQFRIAYSRSIQQFQGWIFTADGQAITGFARLQDRETGFYAVREK